MRADVELLLEPEAAAREAIRGRRVRQRRRTLPGGLTERELEILLVLVRGGSNREIADHLGISAKTVGHHVQHVYEKAGVHSRASATRWAFEHGLVAGARRPPDRAGAAGQDMSVPDPAPSVLP